MNNLAKAKKIKAYSLWRSTSLGWFGYRLKEGFHYGLDRRIVPIILMMHVGEGGYLSNHLENSIIWRRKNLL